MPNDFLRFIHNLEIENSSLRVRIAIIFCANAFLTLELLKAYIENTKLSKEIAKIKGAEKGE